jgi:hypothetical protein
MESSDIRPNMFLVLLAQYNRAVVPLSTVVKDYFPQLTEAKLLRKALGSQVQLPITRIERMSPVDRQKLVRQAYDTPKNEPDRPAPRQ